MHALKIIREYINEHHPDIKNYCTHELCYVRHVEHYHLDELTITFRRPPEFPLSGCYPFPENDKK
jgi:hypothetical protein